MGIAEGSATLAVLTMPQRMPSHRGARLGTARLADRFERTHEIGFQSRQDSRAVLHAERIPAHGFVYQCAERHRYQGARTIALGISSYPALWSYLQREGRCREYGIFYGPPR